MRRPFPALTSPLLPLLVLLALPARAAQLDYVIWQPDRQDGFGDPAVRASHLDRMLARGTQELILQFTAHGPDSLLDDEHDPVRGLLDQAAARGIRVWLGTAEEPILWRRRFVPLGAWRAAADRGLEEATRIAERLGGHRAFAGWYWTPEAVWWTAPSTLRVDRLAFVTRDATQRLRALAAKPVLVALGPSGRGQGNVLMASWCRYLDVVRPDGVVLMDGVGSGHLDVAVLPGLYGALGECAARVDALLWADIEVFSPDLRTPPAPARLDAQLSASVGRRGAFDLTHHLAPGSVAERWWGGATPGPPDSVIVGAAQPIGDWRARPVPRSASLRTQLPRPAARLELLLRGPPARAVSATVDGAALGSLVRHHGPHQDEETWVLEGPVPAGQLQVDVAPGRWGNVPGPLRLWWR